MTIIYDVAILGAGVAGAFAAYKICDEKKLKCCLIEFGRPPGKRRKQLEGWLGCFPSSNARLYFKSDNIKSLCGVKAFSSNEKLLKNIMFENGNINESKNKEPAETVKKRLKKFGYSLDLNNYIQWKPESIHSLSRFISEKITDKENLEFMFDTEVKFLSKEKDLFCITTEYGKIYAKKVLLCLGRSGWRLTHNILNLFGIVKQNDYANFGFKVELSAYYMKEWNESHCSMTKDNIKIGPLCWRGTVVPEDHCDLVITAWRSNEDRWHSEKVSFSVIGSMKYDNKGVEQTERLSKLAYVLSDNRVGKIKIKEFMAKTNDIYKVPEYEWFINEMLDVNKIIPNFTERAFMYVPDIITNRINININKNLSTDIEGLFVAGESGGFGGIVDSAMSGLISASNIIRG